MQAGERIGPWEVQAPLGEGGMGEVWSCHHVDDGRRGALKVLLHGMGDDALARFEREMLALGKLRHHAIVSLLDHDLSDPTFPWLVMEHIDGQPLDEVIDQGPMPLHSVLRPFAALADGLAQAHAYGIHHRDVKSNNVILQPDGTLVLVDFGAAIEDDSSQVTQAGLMLGTTRYLPPEVVCGEDRDLVSADIYALGMLLYEAVSGRHAFRGESGPLKFREVLSLKMKTRHLDPGEPVPDEVRNVVRLATAADPDERLDRMDDMADLLEVASGTAGRTPMMSLRRSERIAHLGARPSTGATPAPPPPPPAPATPQEPTERRRNPPRDTSKVGEPTVRLGADTVRLALSGADLDGPTVRLKPTDSALVPDTSGGIDWMLLGALVFLFTGLFSSASVLVLGFTLALVG